MKAFTYSVLCMLLSIMYSCSNPEIDDHNETNSQLLLEQLQDFAKSCGYRDLTINISRPLTEEDIKWYRSIISNKAQTRQDYQVYMYLGETYYKGNTYTLQFDYRLNKDTGEVKEAYGGILDRSSQGQVSYNGYRSIQSIFSRPGYMNRERFELNIRAYYLTSSGGPYGGRDAYNQHCYRLTILAGLNLNTNSHYCDFQEQGEGEWPLEP